MLSIMSLLLDSPLLIIFGTPVLKPLVKRLKLKINLKMLFLTKTLNYDKYSTRKNPILQLFE